VRMTKTIDMTMTAVGIRLGMAVSAGIIGEARTMSHVQIARMIEELAMDDRMIGALIAQALEDGSTKVDPVVWAERMRAMMARTNKPRLVATEAKP